jgi:hypothetical protein
MDQGTRKLKRLRLQLAFLALAFIALFLFLGG